MKKEDITLVYDNTIKLGYANNQINLQYNWLPSFLKYLKD